jgi:molecular chaperone GrpE
MNNSRDRRGLYTEEPVTQDQNPNLDEQNPEEAPEREPGREPEAEAEADPLERLAAERDQLQDRLLRLAAETENYKKRSEREKADFLKRSNERLLRDLLPVLDNLDRAIAAGGEAGGEAVLEGLNLTRRELWKVLERHGVEPVEALGKKFDPELHEAMMQQEDPDAEDNTVLQEPQKGYIFHGRLLRPAMVVVSKKPAPADDDGREAGATIN